MPDDNKPTNLRELRKQSERRYLIAVLLVLVVVGTVIIGLVYGWGATLTALLCLVPGAALIVVLFLFWKGVDVWLHKDE